MSQGWFLKYLTLCWCWVSVHRRAQALMSLCPVLSQQLTFCKARDPSVPQQPWDPWLWPSRQHSSLANLQSPLQWEDQLMQAVMWGWVHWGQNPLPAVLAEATAGSSDVNCFQSLLSHLSMISWHRALAGWLQRPYGAFLGVSTQGFLNTAGLEGNTKKLNQKMGGVAALGDLEAGWSGGSKSVLAAEWLRGQPGLQGDPVAK